MHSSVVQKSMGNIGKITSRGDYNETNRESPGAARNSIGRLIKIKIFFWQLRLPSGIIVVQGMKRELILSCF